MRHSFVNSLILKAFLANILFLTAATAAVVKQDIEATSGSQSALHKGSWKVNFVEIEQLQETYFKGITEYFTGKESPKRKVVLRSDSEMCPR